jgi:glycosyltransferase involved in cell wall biosynthesis
LEDILQIKKITEHKWLDDSIPKVSISCIAFNQANYIRKTLDSFLMQETNFLVEVLIHDDASTDGTDLIIMEYCNNYPNIFKPIFQKENQYSKLGFMFAFLELKRARGKYIALCEGDDYWSNKLKLFKQVQLLDNDLNASFCFHASDYLFNTSFPKFQLNTPKYIPDNNRFEIIDLINLDSQLVTNCSVMMRTEYVQNLPKWLLEAPVGDLSICLYLGTFGSMAFINESMSVYRVNSIGSWTNEMASRRLYRIRHLKKLKIMWFEFDKWTNYIYKNSIQIRITQINRAILIARLSSFRVFEILINIFRKRLT